MNSHDNVKRKPMTQESLLSAPSRQSRIALQDKKQVRPERGTMSKSRDPNYQQLNVLVEKDNVRELKARALYMEKDASDVVNELIAKFLNHEIKL